ncbi:hypothetical protein TSA1_32835 [Bradyrhizobium nitroreducens]|uniref:Uncharacterized protein n=1 Tax=Bradyrhizobium nitroreducens TaxID=709803 RepID=A0A2M6UK48_9BRAD|nr:hypothetical protein [Bradyrhizobium nitroreducens]PIT04993.1 hypothetical protein TSA1_32835 [Bradyrhizobium nitroreducens]
MDTLHAQSGDQANVTRAFRTATLPHFRASIQQPRHIPAEANPHHDGSDDHALWAAGHEKIAGTIEAGESEGR